MKICEKERDALKEETRTLDACDKFGRLESSEKTIEIDGGRRWRNRTIGKANSFHIVYGRSVNARPNVGGISIRSRNGAPSRKGCVVSGQMTKANKK